MTIPWSRLVTNTVRWFVIPLATCFLLFSVSFSIPLHQAKDAMALAFREYWGEGHLTIGSVQYLFPHLVIFNDVHWWLPSRRDGGYVEIGRLTLRISPWKAFFDRADIIEAVILKDAHFQVSDKLISMTRHVMNDRLSFLGRERSLKVVLNRNVFHLGAPHEQRSIQLDGWARSLGGTFHAGLEVLTYGQKDDKPLTLLSVSGQCTRDECRIRQADIQRDNLEMKVSGQLQRHSFFLQGYALYDLHVSNKAKNVKQLRKLLRSKHFQPDLFLLNQRIVGSWEENGLRVEEWTGDINRFSVQGRGEVFLKNGFLARGQWKAERQDSEGETGSGLQGLGGEMIIHWQADDLELSSGKMDLRWSEGASVFPLSEIQGIRFESIRIGRGGPFTTISAKDVDGQFLLDGIPKNVRIDLVEWDINNALEDLIVSFPRIKMWEGEGSARIWTPRNRRAQPWAMKVTGRDFEVSELCDIWPFSAQIEGRLDFNAFVRKGEKTDIHGYAHMREGRMESVPVFNWLSNFLDIPSARSFPFDRLWTQFRYDGEQTRFEDIQFTAQHLTLNGDANILDDGFIQSEIAVDLGKPWLQESPYLRVIMKKMSPEQQGVHLNFKMSGHWRRVNFQWLPSSDKADIMTLIPDFVERKIEDNIDQLSD